MGLRKSNDGINRNDREVDLRLLGLTHPNQFSCAQHENPAMRNYLIVTVSYWAFTITDGALRMLVVLFFHQLGYSPFEIASLFLFYEAFGVVTNLVGGWLGARVGLNRTLHIGMMLQVIALAMLAVDTSWLTVFYVMTAQALSGIAKDLNKMSAKASVKLMLPENSHKQRLFKWVAVLTGSKNSLKGFGFFLGGLLLGGIGFRGALMFLGGMLMMVLVASWMMLPNHIGKAKANIAFRKVFDQPTLIHWLSGARLFLFSARDVWFVVAAPVFLSEALGWSYTQVGSFLAMWVIGYGIVQSFCPQLVKRMNRDGVPGGRAALYLVMPLVTIPAAMVLLLQNGYPPGPVLIVGLALFGILFALNSAIHSFLVVAWAESKSVSVNVGFYYMANAGGRLLGAVLSGMTYQTWGLKGSLGAACVLLVFATLFSLRLAAAESGGPVNLNKRHS